MQLSLGMFVAERGFEIGQMTWVTPKPWIGQRAEEKKDEEVVE